VERGPVLSVHGFSLPIETPPRACKTGPRSTGLHFTRNLRFLLNTDKTPLIVRFRSNSFSSE